MPPSRSEPRRFQATLQGVEKGRVYLTVPFDPADAWGARSRYDVRGTINGMNVRGTLEDAPPSR